MLSTFNAPLKNQAINFRPNSFSRGVFHCKTDSKQSNGLYNHLQNIHKTVIYCATQPLKER